MNKAELVEKLAERAELSNRAAKGVVDALFSIDDGIIAKELKSKGKVQITGFGTFSADHRPARDWRIPGTDKTKHVIFTIDDQPALKVPIHIRSGPAPGA